MVALLGLVLGCERATEPCYELPCPPIDCAWGTCAWEHEGPVVTADMLVEADAARLGYAPPTWLGASDDNIVAQTDLQNEGNELCARYADVAGRVVNGWYPTGFDRVGYGGLIGALGSTSVPDRTIGWSCSSEGLYLELDLPATDSRHQSADDALADILSALPWRGLDAKGDVMRIVVMLVKSGDVAVFEPANG